MVTLQRMILTTGYTDKEKIDERGNGVAREYYTYSMEQSPS
jgi:hypothetical protein